MRDRGAHQQIPWIKVNELSDTRLACFRIAYQFESNTAIPVDRHVGFFQFIEQFSLAHADIDGIGGDAAPHNSTPLLLNVSSVANSVLVTFRMPQDAFPDLLQH
jgi:hypothetical protein